MNLTPAAFSFRGLALPALIATSAISALGFLWPFLISTPQARPQWLFALALPCALLLLFASVSNNKLDTKSIALLAVLTAVIAALRPMGTGAVRDDLADIVCKGIVMQPFSRVGPPYAKLQGYFNIIQVYFNAL